MLHEVNGNTIAMLWDSTMEPYEMVKSGHWNNDEQKARAAKMASGQSCGHAGPEKWFGAPNFETVTKRLQHGWPEGSDRLLKLATREINPVSIRRRRERADQGAELDIHAVYRGDLSKAWTRTRRRSGSGVRNVTILCNLCDSANVSSEHLFWRGAAVLKLADALTESGYTVAIYGFEAGRATDESGKLTVCQFVEIKADDQPLDLDRLAALTAMPGYFRTALFAGIVKACDLVKKTAGDGLGNPKHDGIAEIAAMLPAIPSNAVVQTDVNDQRSAEAWIDSVLDSLETPATAEA